MRHVDPQLFQCEAGLIDWGLIWKLQYRRDLIMAGFDDINEDQIDFVCGLFEEAVLNAGRVLHGAHLRWSTARFWAFPAAHFGSGAAISWGSLLRLN
uniref:Uncharacterized protein n=1 Tax=Yoonia rhodophyticola TaxID=3137370 RepID=A0AAN0NHX0_9RHOB